MAKNVRLGSVVRDRITGFTGLVYGTHQYLSGCSKVTLQPMELDKDGKPRATEWFDEQQVEVLRTPDEVGSLMDPPQGDVGGPMEEPRRTL